MKRIIFFAILFFQLFAIGISSSIASSNSSGSFGAGFKNIGHSAFIAAGKTITMSAVEDIHYNPARLAISKNSRNIDVSSTFSKLFSEFDGIKYSELDAVIPYSSVLFGITYSALNVDDMRAADNFGLTGNMFDAKYELIKFEASKKLRKDWSIGISADWYRTSIKDYSLSNWTFSAGTSYLYKNFQFNVLLQNIFSSSATAKRKKEKYPFNIDLTCQYTIVESLIFGAALNKERDNDVNFRIGLKYLRFKVLSVSAGYISESHLPSAGFSININKIKCHYSLTKHTDLDISHRISLDISF